MKNGFLLTYSDNRAGINEKKGAHKGIDGVAYTHQSKDEIAHVLLLVKSGKNVGASEIRDLFGTVKSEGAAGGIYNRRWSAGIRARAFGFLFC